VRPQRGEANILPPAPLRIMDQHRANSRPQPKQHTKTTRGAGC